MSLTLPEVMTLINLVLWSLLVLQVSCVRLSQLMLEVMPVGNIEHGAGHLTVATGTSENDSVLMLRVHIVHWSGKLLLFNLFGIVMAIPVTPVNINWTNKFAANRRSGKVFSVAVLPVNLVDRTNKSSGLTDPRHFRRIAVTVGHIINWASKVLQIRHVGENFIVMVLLIDIVHWTLEIFELLNLLDNFVVAMIAFNVVYRTGQLLEVCHVLLNFLEVMSTLDFVYWAMKGFQSIEVGLNRLEVMVTLNLVHWSSQVLQFINMAL